MLLALQYLNYALVVFCLPDSRNKSQDCLFVLCCYNEDIVTTIAHLFLCFLICRLSMKRMKKPFKSITTKWRYAKVPRLRISKPQCRFAIVRWLTVPIWLSATLNITVAVPFRPCSMQKRKTKRSLIFQTNNGRFASLLLH